MQKNDNGSGITKWSWQWLLWVVFVIASTSAVLRGCFFRPTTNFAGEHFNQGVNAVWLGVEWVNQAHDEAKITALANDLNQRQIRYVFAYTSYLKSNGRFNPTYSYAAKFNNVIKGSHPHIVIQAWIGLPLEYLDLGDVTLRKKNAVFCADLVHDEGFDGIHLNPEPIPTDDANVLALLDEVRGALGEEAELSIATRQIWPVLSNVKWPIIDQRTWRASYYSEVAKRVDQIAVMTYDSAMPLAFLYRQWMQFQVVEISRAVEGTGVQLFFGVPTYEERSWTHRPSVENMRAGLEGIIAGLNDKEARPAAVTGVAIYPYWETNKAEWTVYEALWLGQ